MRASQAYGRTGKSGNTSNRSASIRSTFQPGGEGVANLGLRDAPRAVVPGRELGEAQEVHDAT